MQLTLNGHPQTLVPVQQFRAQYNLPNSFGVDYFEPKNWAGLGSMGGAGGALQQLRTALVSAVPAKIPPPAIFSVVEGLTVLFLEQLTAANAVVGLRPVEIDYAVAGFQDVLQAGAYRLMQLHHLSNAAGFDFESIYQTWLDDSVRVASRVHRYSSGHGELAVRVINYAYGRIGLAVEIGSQVVYVLDGSLACPAAVFMHDLCREVCLALAAAVQPPSA
ncbi:MAG: hypothetical protein FOGNACKC_02353 [Anaerolineae bacterium]|nr:hypothetical protein [Anaerolineae bacterium]